VAASEVELGLLMLCQRKGRRAVTLQVVALVTLILIGLAGELIVVLIHVAISAPLEVDDFEDGVLALWGVAAVALHLGMPVNQGVVGFCVRLDVEQRRLPSIHVVAGGALDAVGFPFRELAVVLILVAVGALRERQFLLEIAFDVTGFALDRGVLTQQRIFGL